MGVRLPDGDGVTANRQIGAELFLAEKTSRIFAKLGLERRAQAAVLATRIAQDERPQP